MLIHRPSRLAVVLCRRLFPQRIQTATMAGKARDVHPKRIMFGRVSDDLPGLVRYPNVIKLAGFAVAEYNNTTKGMLEFERLVRVTQQVVAGKLYYLTVEAKKLYEAKVWEKVWEKFQELSSFEPVLVSNGRR